MPEIISKEELDYLSQIKGEVRGLGLKIISDFALKEKGEEGLRLLEKTMEELGYPLKYKKVNVINFYPLSVDIINLIVASRLFNFDDKKIQEIGRTLARAPLALRVFLKYLTSFNNLTADILVMWKKAYSVGSMNLIELNRQEKYVILRLENFDIHSIYCQLFIGYFPTILQMVVKKDVSCEETKCTFRGDPYHEFILKW